VWAEAAKWLAKFPDTVITALDAEGYPVSVRQVAPRYDATNGLLVVEVPDALRITEGPANLLCHSHDEELWSLNAIHIKGRLEYQSAWLFVTTAFTPPPRWALIGLWQFARSGRAAARRYLDWRGLGRPVVNWDAVHELRHGSSRRRRRWRSQPPRLPWKDRRN
jgi:hypothetical protein